MLGSLLKAMREGAGLSLLKVRGKLGIPRSTLYMWESPASRPEPEDLQRLLDLYRATDEQRLKAWELRAGVGHQSSAA